MLKLLKRKTLRRRKRKVRVFEILHFLDVTCSFTVFLVLLYSRQSVFLNFFLCAGTSEAPKHTCQNSTSLAACEDDSYIENHLSTSSLIANDILKILKYKSVGFDEIRKLTDLRKSLYGLLKPEISQLCKILKLPVWISFPYLFV